MKHNIESKLLNIFQTVLHDKSITLDNVPDYDSLAYISLVISIEKEFNISFTIDELNSFLSISKLVETIESKI